MAHKILMLGGRRCGKSSILASILYELQNSTDESLCTFEDKTEYAAQTEEDGIAPVTLTEKKRQLGDYIDQHKRTNIDNQFIVDMSPDQSKTVYTVEMDIKGAKAELDFVDVPGEWMRENDPSYNDLQEEVKNTDVFIIAVDTPFLMKSLSEDGNDAETSERQNGAINRVDEITKLLSDIKSSSDIDNKLIILCPVKSERWFDDDNIKLVTQKTKKTYSRLINKYIDNTEANVKILIMPLETAGGIRFKTFRKALVLENGDKEEKCSLDEYSNLLIMSNGELRRNDDNLVLKDDSSANMGDVVRPNSWFVANGKGFKPRLCNQVAYQVVKFLVEKETEVELKRSKYTRWLKVLIPEKYQYFFDKIWKGIFGDNLDRYQKFTEELNKRGYITEDPSEGFAEIKEEVK